MCLLKETKKDAKKKKKGSDDSALEESDDGDEEGRELDYISDSSDRYLNPLLLLFNNSFFFFRAICNIKHFMSCSKKEYFNNKTQ